MYQKLKGEYEELMGDIYSFTGFTPVLEATDHFKYPEGRVNNPPLLCKGQPIFS